MNWIKDHPWLALFVAFVGYVGGCVWIANRIGARGQSLSQYPRWFEALVNPGAMIASVVLLAVLPIWRSAVVRSESTA